MLRLWGMNRPPNTAKTCGVRHAQGAIRGGSGVVMRRVVCITARVICPAKTGPKGDHPEIASQGSRGS